MMQFRKVYVSLVKEIGLEGAYIFDALVNARNFQNTTEVIFTRSDAESIGLKRSAFDKAIKALENSGYIARIPNTNPMRFIIQDKAESIESSSKGQERHAEIQQGNLSEFSKATCQNSAIPTIKRNKENTRELVRSFSNTRIIDKVSTEETDKTNQLENQIDAYFLAKGSNTFEARKFIRYNRSRYGDYHITVDNFRALADMWLKPSNMKRKPQRISERSSYKTPREIAESRGVSVAELFSDKPEKDTAAPSTEIIIDTEIESVMAELFPDANQATYTASPLLKAV